MFNGSTDAGHDRAGHTYAFDDTAAWLVTHCSKSAVRDLLRVATAEPLGGNELVVAEDGSTPADQVKRLGLGPGARLRVIATRQAGEPGFGVAGSLPDFPDLDWADFERGSALGRSGLSAR